MKLYLAGPMTGHRDYNFPTFMRYAKLLREKGHDVVNPAEESLLIHGIEWKGSLTAAEFDQLGTTEWSEYVEKDLEIIRNDVEAVAVLPGWQDSKGACLEVETARKVEKPVYSAVLLAMNGEDNEALIGDPIEPDVSSLYGDAGDFIAFAENPERQRTVTGAVKDNRSKARMDLIPAAPLHGAGLVLGYGADKYKPNNWRLGLGWSDTYASLLRHLLAFNEGEDIDPESHLPHIDHAMCQLLFLSHYYHTGEGDDDRWTSTDQEEAKA